MKIYISSFILPLLYDDLQTTAIITFETVVNKFYFIFFAKKKKRNDNHYYDHYTVSM